MRTANRLSINGSPTGLPSLSIRSPSRLVGFQKKIKQFESISDDIGKQDSGLQDAFHNATIDFLLKVKGVEISLDTLFTVDAGMYHGIKVQTADMHGNPINQSIRCTGSSRFYGSPPRLDWVWARLTPIREGCLPPFKALKGRTACRLLRLFTLSLRNVSKNMNLHCAFVQTTKVAAGGLPEEESTMVRVLPTYGHERYRVISAATIVGAAHLVPEDPTSEIGWTVNSHIDCATWNDIYWMYEDDLRAAVESGLRGGKRKR